MPASRSARAMILAPRSWPSRPGLATTTRIFFSLAAGIGGAGIVGLVVSGVGTGRLECDRPGLGGHLEDRRFAIAPEHRLEGLDDLALGRLAAGCLEQQRHQVLVGIARRLDELL